MPKSSVPASDLGAEAMASSPPLILILFLLAVLFFSPYYSQQPYTNNAQLDCYSTNASSVLGYSCNGAQPSCSSFLTFRANPPYLSPALLAFLLSADAASISLINSVSDVDSLPVRDFVLIPIHCSCSGRFYQHNASYTLKTLSETYLTVANDTYQGLSTCQALMDQNPIDSHNLSVGVKLAVPLRCACPTLNQRRTGFQFLVSYLVTWGDSIPTIAQAFRADYKSVLAANELTEKSTIYPFTTLLIPLSAVPNTNSSQSSLSPKQSEVPVPPPPSSGGRSSHAGLYAGIGAGLGSVLLLGALVLFLCIRRRQQRQPAKPLNPQKTLDPASSFTQYGELPFKTASLSSQTTVSPLASSLRDVLDWVTMYRFDELQMSTGNFDEEHRIRGSVYRGIINGDAAAIKRLKGDATNEIRVLKQISHSSLVRLSGFCIHEGNTFMVYEYAELGSLSDWLHDKKKMSDSSCLSWKQRIQIACNVADGLNYLHNYMNPPYIHKNLKSSNVLISRDFRAKVANFGLARPAVEEEGLQQVTLHVVGTQGYLAPEYLERGIISPKLDVYAFGVVLLELLSGKEAAFVAEGKEEGEVLLSSVADDVLRGEDARSKLRAFLDPCLGNNYPFDLAFVTTEIARRCVYPDAASRPDMNELFASLSAIYNSSLDWDPEEETATPPASAVYGR